MSEKVKKPRASNYAPQGGCGHGQPLVQSRSGHGMSRQQLAEVSGARVGDICAAEEGKAGLVGELQDYLTKQGENVSELASEQSVFIVQRGKMIDMPAKPLHREFRYFVEHQDELVRKYKGRVIAIKGEAVIGVFDTEIDAIRETEKEHELGTFIVQQCEPGSACYTAVFHGHQIACPT